MSNISISGAGGPSGPGGIEPTQTKGMGNVGEASEGDVAKFQESMGQTEGAQGKQPADTVQGSPFDMQANRITDSSQAQNPSLGQELVGDMKKMMNVGKAQEKAIMDKFNQVGDKGWSPADAMQFQYMAGEMQLMTEIVSKGVNKTVQAVQQLARNQ